MGKLYVGMTQGSRPKPTDSNPDATETYYLHYFRDVSYNTQQMQNTSFKSYFDVSAYDFIKEAIETQLEDIFSQLEEIYTDTSAFDIDGVKDLVEGCQEKFTQLKNDLSTALTSISSNIVSAVDQVETDVSASDDNFHGLNVNIGNEYSVESSSSSCPSSYDIRTF